MECVQHPFLRLHTDAALDAQISHLEGFWMLVTHWVYKQKFNSQHKLPIRLQGDFRTGLEAWGNVVHQFLELAIQCHALPSEENSKYKNAAEWFTGVVHELKGAQLRGIFKPGSKSKKESVSKFRSMLKGLKEDINPFNPALEPHTFRLVECAIRIQCLSDNWRKNHWVPFLKAWSAFVTNLDRNPAWRMIERTDDGQFVAQKGRGKYKPTLPAKNDASKPLQCKAYKF